MLFIELIFGLLVYSGIWYATVCVLRMNRSAPRYAIGWAVSLATCVVFTVILLETRGSGISQLLTEAIRLPNEDMWGLKAIGLFFALLFAVPLPIGIACLCVPPSSGLLASRASRITLLLTSAILMFLHFTYHRVATLHIQDQFGNPVPDVKVTYYMDGRTTESTDQNGELEIDYYEGVHRLAVTDAVAGGYKIDYRLCSHRPYEPIPREMTLPAWKIIVAPQLLYIITHADIATDGKPCYLNILHEKATDSVDPGADLEIQVDAPEEPPPEPGEFRAKPFVWKVRVRVRQGGWAHAPEKYAYLAPDNGYQETFEKTYSPTAHSWNFCRENYYLKLRNGRLFAAAEISVSILNDRKGRVSVIAHANPASDRNLYQGDALQLYQSETKMWLKSLFGESY